MAVIITPFPRQRIPIGTPFSLNVAISGNPSTVYATGRLNGFYTHWTGTHLEIRGTPDAYTNIDVTIVADDQRFTQTFSIVRIPPIIGALTRVTVQTGGETRITIPITGSVNHLVVRGPYIGLRHRLKEDGDGELYGIIPSNRVFTRRNFSFSIEAYNRDVFDTAELDLEIGIGG